MGNPDNGPIIAYRSIEENYEETALEYPLSPGGYFGVKGRGDVRLVISGDPIGESAHLYYLLGRGGIESDLPNGRGKITKLPDGAVISYRIVSASDGSPAVQLDVKRVIRLGRAKSQKIHFVKEQVQ